eukprot:EG_transcript_7074
MIAEELASDDLAGRILGSIGDHFAKAVAASFVFGTAPAHLQEGELTKRLQALMSELLWDDFLRDLPSRLILDGPAEPLRLPAPASAALWRRVQWARGLFAAVAVRRDVALAGAQMVRLLFAAEAERQEQAGWVTTQDVLAALLPGLSIAKQEGGEGWVVQDRTLKLEWAGEQLALDLSGSWECKEALRRTILLRIWGLLETMCGASVTVCVRHSDGFTLRAQCGGTAVEVRCFAPTEAEARDQAAMACLRRLAAPSPPSVKALSPEEQEAVWRPLVKRVRRILRRPEPLAPFLSAPPRDGFVPFAAVLRFLEGFSGLPSGAGDGLLAFLQRHDPLRKLAVELCPDGPHIRTNYDPSPKGRPGVETDPQSYRILQATMDSSMAAVPACAYYVYDLPNAWADVVARNGVDLFVSLVFVTDELLQQCLAYRQAEGTAAVEHIATATYSLDLRAIVSDGWVVRLGISPHTAGLVLLRPQDNPHLGRGAAGAAAGDGRFPFHKYVMRVLKGTEWVSIDIMVTEAEAAVVPPAQRSPATLQEGPPDTEQPEAIPAGVLHRSEPDSIDAEQPEADPASSSPA